MRAGALSRIPFRMLFIGQSVSALGDRLVPVALAFAVLELTGSVTDLGLVIAAQTTPLVLFVLVGGVWGDRLPRRRVMLASDGIRALSQGWTAVLLLAGAAHVWQLAVLQAVYGTAKAFFGPASLALVPETVAASDLQQANALLGLSDNVASVLGPALAGVVVATAGPGWGLALDAATFVVSAVFLGLMRLDDGGGAELPRRAPAGVSRRAGMLSDLRAGWDAFRSREWLWITVLYFTLYLGFVLSPWQVLGPEVARQSLGGAGAWAAISAALGVGAVAGGVVALRWRPRYPLRASLIVFLIGSPALLVLLAARAPLPVIIAVALVDGSSGTVFNVMWFTALQSDVPPAELSRVSSWDYLGSLAIQPVGQALSGPVAVAIGVSTTLYGAGALSLLLVLVVLAVPAVRNFRSQTLVH